MKFSELWLREYVDINLINTEDLLNQITMAGLEVENIKPVADAFNGIIVGKIVECNNHYNVKNLRVIKVDVGDKYLLEIVCSISNCHLGMKVAIATTGAVLSNNRRVKIENLYGQLSEGMLCSYSDLGIYDGYDGIIELPEDAPVGTDIRSYLKLCDNIIEVNVTPNRADCLSIIGIAREIAIINKTKLKVPYIFSVENTINDNLLIQVDAIDACPRYLGRVIKDINLKVFTPLWMKEKLRRCGTRSVDVIVDITNYILLELGQPIHIFDKDRIYGGIVVRMAKEGETLILLNGNKAKLNADTLVIADYDKVLAIGGIFGGKYSSISDNTQNILLGCAFFNPLFITGRARRYGLYTDISHRYECGVDPALQYAAIERATKLLIDICGGKAGPIIDITNESTLPKHSTIILRRSKLDRLIGHHINNAQINDILSRLGCNFIKSQTGWQVIAPSWRFDIKIEEDLVEEVARIYGYNNIPSQPIQTSLLISIPSKSYLSLKRIKILLNDKGYQEAITYSFVDPKIQQLIYPNKEALIITNPISSEMSVMRLSLWTGLLRTIIYNQNRQQSRMRIFETGMCFIPDTQADMGVRQELMLACAIYGNRYEEHWDLTKDNVDFYDIKGDLESVLDFTGKLSEVAFRVKVIPALHPGQSAAIYLKDECIGFIGVLHPKLEHELNLKCRTMLFELKWSKIADRVLSKVQDVSRFPAKRYDIAIVVAENIPAADVLNECKKISISQIVNVNLFDVYRGSGIAKGFKSLAISLIFQDNNRTLKEKDITIAMNKCVKKLKEKFHASLRDETYGAYNS